MIAALAAAVIAMIIGALIAGAYQIGFRNGAYATYDALNTKRGNDARPEDGGP